MTPLSEYRSQKVQVISGPRGSGRTLRMFRWAMDERSDEHRVIVVPRLDTARILLEEARERHPERRAWWDGRIVDVVTLRKRATWTGITRDKTIVFGVDELENRACGIVSRDCVPHHPHRSRGRRIGGLKMAIVKKRCPNCGNVTYGEKGDVTESCRQVVCVDDVRKRVGFKSHVVSPVLEEVVDDKPRPLHGTSTEEKPDDVVMETHVGNGFEKVEDGKSKEVEFRATPSYFLRCLRDGRVQIAIVMEEFDRDAKGGWVTIARKPDSAISIGHTLSEFGILARAAEERRAFAKMKSG